MSPGESASPELNPRASFPACSVIIPTYDRARVLPRAVDSALRETRPGDEILVVDDGSNDDTLSVLARYGDRVRAIPAPHGGVAAARNRGLEEARGHLIAFLDSDDEWLPGKLELQRRLMHHRPDLAYCFTDMQASGPDGGIRHDHLRDWHADPRSWDEILGPGRPFSTLAPLPEGQRDCPTHIGSLYGPLMRRLYMPADTLVVRREVAGGLPRFPTDLDIYEDWEFFARLARRGPGAYLDLETAIQHGHRMARVSDADELSRARCYLKMLERTWGSDPGFLEHHSDDYLRLVKTQRRLAASLEARALLTSGRVDESREAFRRIGGPPPRYRVLLSLPGPVIRWLMRARGSLRRSRVSAPATASGVPTSPGGTGDRGGPGGPRGARDPGPGGSS